MNFGYAIIYVIFVRLYALASEVRCISRMTKIKHARFDNPRTSFYELPILSVLIHLLLYLFPFCTKRKSLVEKNITCQRRGSTRECDSYSILIYPIFASDT